MQRTTGLAAEQRFRAVDRALVGFGEVDQAGECRLRLLVTGACRAAAVGCFYKREQAKSKAGAHRAARPIAAGAAQRQSCRMRSKYLASLD